MILICYGTRPEWIKLNPLIKKISENNIKHKVLYTGQHADIAPKCSDFNIEIKSNENRLDDIIQSLMNLPVFEDINYLMIQGDTTSALALALTAFHRKIKIIHLEAGLRTYDLNNPYPEEMNRQLISRITHIHLCPTKTNKKNLIKEKCQGNKYVVGNTVLDNLVNLKPTYNNQILITLHRRENHNNIGEWFKTISNIALNNKNEEFIIPLHPNPEVQKHKSNLQGIKIVAPLSYEESKKTISECKFIISDSGGMQEEASFLNKKIIVCRTTTERPESLGKHSFLCKKPENLQGLFEEINNNYVIKEKCPFGDGNSSEKIVKILKTYPEITP